jgi:putative transposase
MPRLLRIQYCNAWYHVINRGINHMNIYQTDEHRKIFLSLLAELTDLFEVKIHSYCLMDNDYHLLLQTTHANLSKAMRHLNGIYTQRYNRSENRDGGLFRGRYKAILIESERYLSRVSRYIHLNPLDARMVTDAGDYKWSSYKIYLKKTSNYWLQTSHILHLFGDAESYAAFVTKGTDPDIKAFYSKAQLSPILGCKRFITESLNTLTIRQEIATSTDVRRARNLLNADSICHVIANYFSVSIDVLKNPSKNNFPRLLAIYLVRNLTQLSHQKISAFFNGLAKQSKALARR